MIARDTEKILYRDSTEPQIKSPMHITNVENYKRKMYRTFKTA